jgi:hypothetical protein
MVLYYTTELFVFIDNFTKILSKTTSGKQMLKYWYNKRGPQKKLKLSEVITLNIIRFYYRVSDLKTFHKIAKYEMNHYFPNIPNYENFLKATNKSIGFILIFLKYLLSLNSKKDEKYHFIDSTDLPVCKNYNIYRHKVTKDFSNRGKTSKGWFYGIKVHGVCNIEGELENIFFTSGNVHDNQVLKDLIPNLEGIFICDSGYLLKVEDLQKFIKANKQFFISTRKNMKRLLTKEQLKLFRRRSIIETDWDVLKERFNLVYSFARSIFGLLRHYIYSITSFMLKKWEPKKELLNFI